MAIEPVLQPLSGESFHYATANVEDEATLVLDNMTSVCLKNALLPNSLWLDRAQ